MSFFGSKCEKNIIFALKRGVKFPYSTCNALKIWQKVRNGSVLMGTECLNNRFSRIIDRKNKKLLVYELIGYHVNKILLEFIN